MEQISVMAEKVLTGIDLGQHGICMDLYVEEFEGGRKASVYDIEPNNYFEKDLPRRNRFYQSLIDSKLLPTDTPFSKLPDRNKCYICEDNKL